MRVFHIFVLGPQDPFELNTEDDYDYEEDHKSGFKWRLSTHKDIHGAACNGVLAGLVGITAGRGRRRLRNDLTAYMQNRVQGAPHLSLTLSSPEQ